MNNGDVGSEGVRRAIKVGSVVAGGLAAAATAGAFINSGEGKIVTSPNLSKPVITTPVRPEDIPKIDNLAIKVGAKGERTIEVSDANETGLSLATTLEQEGLINSDKVAQTAVDLLIKNSSQTDNPNDLSRAHFKPGSLINIDKVLEPSISNDNKNGDWTDVLRKGGVGVALAAGFATLTGLILKRRKSDSFEMQTTIVGGTDVGAEVVDKKTGQVAGKAYTQFHPGESRRAGRPVVRGRVEVLPDFRGRKLGQRMAEETIHSLQKTGGVTHQVAFTDKGERSLKPIYDKYGYKPLPGVEGVYKKDY